MEQTHNIEEGLRNQDAEKGPCRQPAVVRAPFEASNFRHGTSPCYLRSPVFQHGRAFSLIELIGVLAVVAIVAALTVPVVIREMDQAARVKERTDLVAISNAVALQILSARTIPREGDLAQVVANWTMQPVARITTTPRSYRRAFLIDTNGWFGTPGGNLPYTQPITGSVTAPLRTRLMIVSTIAEALPVSTGRPGNAAFNNVWITADGLKPTAAPWTTWRGKGEDLIIQRVNLESLFHRLVILNRDRFGSAPRITIDTTNSIAVTSNVIHSFYFDGSVIGLCDPSGIPMKRFTLNKDMGYVFEGGIWREQISSGDSSEALAQDFAALAAKFIASQWYPGAEQGGRTGNQQGALTAMFNFLLVFGLWADQYPHFPQHGAASATQVPEYVLLEDIGGSSLGENAAGFLNQFTGHNGLLNN